MMSKKQILMLTAQNLAPWVFLTAYMRIPLRGNQFDVVGGDSGHSFKWVQI